MSLKALQDYTYYSKYARFNRQAGRRETWSEAVDRVKDMHLSRFPQIKEEIDWAFEQVRRKRVLGSQRALQFGGTPILRKHARLYNCTVSFCDRPRFFQEAFWLLLCGCGVGFSVQKHHIAKLPEFSLFHPSLDRPKTFIIPDTIEGWADALGVLLDSYLATGTPWEGFYVNFDYSLIRKKGSPLSSGSGKAPGPEPLRRSLETIRKLLDRCIKSGERLRPIDAYDIIMHASDAVLSGGVRRSATICLFSPDDMEMVTAKTGNWFTENPQRGRSNNSALLLRNQTTKEDFLKLISSVKEFGEPGFVWSDSTELVVNPCFHRDTRILTENGYCKIGDLYKKGVSVPVVTDDRPGRGSELDLTRTGVSVREASNVRLTQENACIYELETSHGQILRVTDNHEFPTLRGRLKLKDMQEGDKILLQSAEGAFGRIGTFEQGLLLGMVTGDGCFNEEESWLDVWENDFDQCDHLRSILNKEVNKLPSLSNGGRKYGDLEWQNQTSKTAKKRIGGRRLYRFFKEVLGIESPASIKARVPEVVWAGSRDFVRGYLQGLIATDGSVQCGGHAKKTTVSLRITQANQALLQDVQVLLGNFGVVSKIYSRRPSGLRLLPDGKGGKKEYSCKECYEIVVSRPNCLTLEERIGIFGRKQTDLKVILDLRGRDCNKPEKYITSVKSIKYFGKDDVFCLKQFDTNTVIANGCVTGQCVEIGMCPMNEDGVSGWQMCNLCEINGKKIKTKEDWQVAARAAAIIGTCQAAYTDFDYLGPVTKQIVEKEALLGVSITGMMDSPEILFDPELQQEMAKFILDINEKLAPRIGINPCARATCIKPAGTTSCLLGTGSGVHPHHARRYFRRTQANMMEAPLQFFKKHNPHAVRKSVWSANGTDEVITFCVQVPPGAKVKNDLDAITMLQHVKLTQANWVTAGCVKERCTHPWLMHNVSNTINIRPDEWDAVIDFIYENREFFAGISLLPISGDKDFPQAPMCQVFTPKEIVAMYGDGSLLASGLIVDGLKVFSDNLWEACEAVLGLGKQIAEPVQPDGQNFTEHAVYRQQREEYDQKKDWLRRAVQFGDRYFSGDQRLMTYCLKDVANWKEWLDLTRYYKEVDYTEMFESEDNTKPMDTIACSGGQCNI